MRTASSPPSAATLAQAVALFFVAAVATALNVAVDVLLPSIAQTGLVQNALRLTVLALNLSATWIGCLAPSSPAASG